MTTIATTALPLADSWQITVGGGWIIVMLIGMAFCFAMFAFMSLMHGGRGWPTCGLRSPHDTTRSDTLTGTPAERPDAAPSSIEGEAGR